MPTVSVIIPTYNRRAYVQEAIDSVLAQTYTDYEIIVIDDGSTDGTGEALRERYGDKIIYEWQENQGESVARNRGIALAQGEYIAFLDSDDLWLPEKLEKQVAYLEEHPEVGAVACQALLVDSHGEPLPGCAIQGVDIALGDLTTESLALVCAIHNASMVVVRRSIVVGVGGFDSEIQHGEDWDLYIRISAQKRIGQVCEVLSLTRVHAGGQWSSSRGDLIEPRLRDGLRVVGTAFGLLPPSLDTPCLRARAEARLYGDAALRAISTADYERGREWLATAASKDIDGWGNPKDLGERLAGYFARKEGRGAEVRGREWGHVVRETAATLPRGRLACRDRRLFLRGFLPGVFFSCVEKGDDRGVRWTFPRLLLSNPRWATNFGVWSQGLRAYVGNRVWSWLRHIVMGLKWSKPKGKI